MKDDPFRHVYLKMALTVIAMVILLFAAFALVPRLTAATRPLPLVFDCLPYADMVPIIGDIDRIEVESQALSGGTWRRVGAYRPADVCRPHPTSGVPTGTITPAQGIRADRRHRLHFCDTGEDRVAGTPDDLCTPWTTEPTPIEWWKETHVESVETPEP